MLQILVHAVSGMEAPLMNLWYKGAGFVSMTASLQFPVIQQIHSVLRLFAASIRLC